MHICVYFHAWMCLLSCIHVFPFMQTCFSFHASMCLLSCIHVFSFMQACVYFHAYMCCFHAYTWLFSCIHVLVFKHTKVTFMHLLVLLSCIRAVPFMHTCTAEGASFSTFNQAPTLAASKKIGIINISQNKQRLNVCIHPTLHHVKQEQVPVPHTSSQTADKGTCGCCWPKCVLQ